MSEEKINLNDLMNEKFAEEASKEKETTFLYAIRWN